MKKLIPCLWYTDEGEEAAEFYVSLFPKSRITEVTRYGETGPGEPGAVMTVSFELNGREFLALNGGEQEWRFSEAISWQIMCESQDEVDYYWDALTEGGEPGPCGWLKDRFGLSWQVVPTRLTELLTQSDPETSQRVFAAMMQMGKIEIGELEAAAAAEKEPTG
jgi:predicted 3-demethylubiquinone-9 3-methyltransferase (glyoxalase superfamily)